jgi:hypothetical protein
MWISGKLFEVNVTFLPTKLFFSEIFLQFKGNLTWNISCGPLQNHLNEFYFSVVQNSNITITAGQRFNIGLIL